MSQLITLSKLTSLLNEYTGIEINVCESFIRNMAQTIASGLIDGEHINIKDFGFFEPRTAADGTCTIEFIPEEMFARRVNAPFAHLIPSELPSQQPNMSAAPNQPSVPSRLSYPQQPDRPQTPTYPQQTEAPAYARQPDRPQSPTYLQQPEAPAYTPQPDRPQSPTYPQQPEAPTYARQPDRPQSPTYPQQPEAPAYTRQPDKPQTPTYPQQPEAPAYTRQPDRPQTPTYPQQPEAPAYARQPDRPQSPTYPQQPEAPAYTRQPDKPQTPTYPQQPEAPAYARQPAFPQTQYPRQTDSQDFPNQAPEFPYEMPSAQQEGERVLPSYLNHPEVSQTEPEPSPSTEADPGNRHPFGYNRQLPQISTNQKYLLIGILGILAGFVLGYLTGRFTSGSHQAEPENEGGELTVNTPAPAPVQEFDYNSSMSVADVDTLQEENEYVDMPEEVQPAPQPIVVRLQKGQRLSDIAMKHYGKKEFWVYIYLENRNIISNPFTIREGTELRIPPKEKYAPSTDEAANLAWAKTKAAEINSKYIN